MKDTVEEQPVESIEDFVSAAIDKAETNDDEPDTTDDTESSEENRDDSADGDDISDVSEDESEEESVQDETAETDGQTDDDSDTDDTAETQDDIAASEGDDKLDAPEHWSAVDQQTFNEQPREAQEFILTRHKSMEGDYTRKSQAIADTQRQYDAIRDALAPHEQDFARSGLDHAGAVRQLASVHTALKTNGKAAILQLAQSYGIDLTGDDQEPTDPAMASIQQELRVLREQTQRQTDEAQQRAQKDLLANIQAFETEQGADGKLLHPHFNELQNEITKLFQQGMASDLNDGYRKALAWRPDLTTPVVKTVEKTDKAAKVRKAKIAATGVKSSGATNKQRKSMTLEEEIAAQIN